MEAFFCKTKLVCGSGSVAALGQLGCKRLFLVTEPALAQGAGGQLVINAAKCSKVEIFAKEEPEATAALAEAGAARLRAFQPDLVAALGCGSTLSCAKAMVWLGQGAYSFAAIPTTSGSGTEMTDTALLRHGKRWHPIAHPRMQPDLAILDSDLLQQLPKQQIAQGGFEVLGNSLEAYVSRRSGAMTDLLAREAFCSAFGALPASFAGNTAVRLKIHQAAAMAGMAYCHGGLGLCQALARSLSGLFSVPMGALMAIVLPSVIDCNAHVAGKKYAELARAAGIGGSGETIALQNLKSGLRRLRRELNLPETLAQAGIEPRTVWCSAGKITEAVLADPCCRDNPMPVEDFLIRRILEEVTGHYRTDRRRIQTGGVSWYEPVYRAQ